MEPLRVILGSTGLIGSAWKRLYPNSVLVDRSTIGKWFSNKSRISFLNFLENLSNDKEIEIHFCFGDTNPTKELNYLMDLNCNLPLAIAKEALGRNCRIITYGSALEIFSIRNNYFDSKRAFLGKIAKLDTKNLWINVNLHTLYGDSYPHSHMFLGQIYTSLRDKTPFHMSSGKQLRELHHVDDDVLIIEAALRKGTIKQIVISHGKPLQLNEVADYLFNSFGLRELLRKNVLPDNPYDNYSKIFAASPNLDVISHRDPLKSIKDIFAKLLR